MAKSPVTTYRSAISGRYVTGLRGSRHSGIALAEPMTKADVARVEASWKKASEATGAFQRRNPEARSRGETAK